jgi:Mn2+/Fe2+ NRAMP family transporter
MYLSQVLNGILLPVVLVLMLVLVNSRSIMGEHTNSRIGNGLSWTCVILVSGLVLYLAWSAVTGGSG